MRCVVCDRELQMHEKPQRGLPGLCDGCARSAQVWPVRGEREPTEKRESRGELERVTAAEAKS